MHFTEDDFENAILELFREQLGYDYVYGPNVIRDYAEPLYVEVLEAMLPQINRGLPQAAIDEAMVKIRTYEGGTLVQKNELFTDYLQMVLLSIISMAASNVPPMSGLSIMIHHYIIGLQSLINGRSMGTR